MGYRLQKHFRKLQFVIPKKRWREQAVDLGKQIDRVGKLFGEAEALAPARQSRGSSAICQAFEEARRQACSLHEAIIKGFTCACNVPHAFKLVMVKQHKPSSKELQPTSRILRVSFPLSSLHSWTAPWMALEEKDAWCSFDTTIVSPSNSTSTLSADPSDLRESRSSVSFSSLSADSGRSPQRSSFSGSTSTVLTTPTPSTYHGCLSHPFEALQPYTGTTVPPSTTASGVRLFPIDDLCTTIRTRGGDVDVGYLEDSRGAYHLNANVDFSFTSADVGHIISLKAILAGQDGSDVGKGATKTTRPLPRRQRMAIALTLSYALLELFPTPWCPRSLSKLDVYFFQRKNGDIMTENPFYLCESPLSQQQQGSHPLPTAGGMSPSSADDDGSDHSNALLALGIVIMELWFGKTIESRAFYKDYLRRGREGEDVYQPHGRARVTKEDD